MNATNTRAESLAAITGGKPEWYATHKQITRAEGVAGVVWNGSSHSPAPKSRAVRSKCGSWGRQVHGTSAVAALTRRECEELGLTCGPLNG